MTPFWGPQTFVADKWYRAKVIWGVGGNLTGNLYDSDGTTLLNSVSAVSNLYTSGGIAFRGFDGVKAFDTVSKASAVPEPSTLTLSGMALALVGLRAYRRRRAA